MSHYRRPSERQRRLLACAARRFLIEEFGWSGGSIEEIERTERFIEGFASAKHSDSPVREAATQAVNLALRYSARARREHISHTQGNRLEPALQVVHVAGRGDDTDALRRSVKSVSRHYRKAGQKLSRGLIEQDRQRLCDLIRDILGNPYQPPVIEPAWLDANRRLVRAFAEDIDATGRFGDLPVLADALEEGGCRDEIILSHARQPRHYRGCWLIDAILGKK